jgi:uncharacterized membrane protein
MPYCSNCGKEVHERDVYCGGCGTRQAPPSAAAPGASVAASDPLSGVTPRTASILCYIPIIGWIAAVVVLAAAKFRNNRTVRFHAFQGLYLFAAWLLVEWVVHPIFRNMPDHVFPIDHLLQAVILVLWIFMMVKASHEEAYALPIIGELAERSASEHS